MIKQLKTEQALSMFLGAYDLDRDLDLSKKMVIKSKYLWTHAYGNIYRLRELGFPRSGDFCVNYRGIPINKVLARNDLTNPRSVDFLTVCRMVEGKGIEELLYALAELTNENIQYNQVIVGGGPLLNSYKKLAAQLGIEGNILFTGYLSFVEVEKWMQKSKYFVLLSEKSGECLPNVIKEALLNGCYVLTAQSNNIEELIVSEDIGVIVQQSCHHEIVKYLKLFKKEQRVNNIDASNKLLLENFDLRKSVKTYLQKWRIDEK